MMRFMARRLWILATLLFVFPSFSLAHTVDIGFIAFDTYSLGPGNSDVNVFNVKATVSQTAFHIVGGSLFIPDSLDFSVELLPPGATTLTPGDLALFTVS